jgi:hypothetical protein
MISVPQSMFEAKAKALKFSKLCREVDRIYEVNNNGQLDNGVYHKKLLQNSFEEEADDVLDSQRGIKVQQALIEEGTNKHSSAVEGMEVIYETFQKHNIRSLGKYLTLRKNCVDKQKIQKLTRWGYPK